MPASDGKMYHVDGACPDNETLALRLQGGDVSAVALLLSRNEGYLTGCASKLCRQYNNHAMLEDLKQEGAVALIDAAKRFDVGRGAQLLSYAGSAIHAAMVDFAAEGALAVSMPSDRFRQLRRVAEIVADEQTSEGKYSALQRVCEELGVSKGVARNLLAEYRTLFRFDELSEDRLPSTWDGDPAKAYDRRMRKKLAVKLLGEVLKPRERNVVIYHLGIGQQSQMTFEELAARLNYNDPSAAEKAYKRAIKKLQQHKNDGELGTWIWAIESIRKTMRVTRQ